MAVALMARREYRTGSIIYQRQSDGRWMGTLEASYTASGRPPAHHRLGQDPGRGGRKLRDNRLEVERNSLGHRCSEARRHRSRRRAHGRTETEGRQTVDLDGPALPRGLRRMLKAASRDGYASPPNMLLADKPVKAVKAVKAVKRLAGHPAPGRPQAARARCRASGRVPVGDQVPPGAPASRGPLTHLGAGRPRRVPFSHPGSAGIFGRTCNTPGMVEVAGRVDVTRRVDPLCGLCCLRSRRCPRPGSGALCRGSRGAVVARLPRRTPHCRAGPRTALRDAAEPRQQSAGASCLVTHCPSRHQVL